MQPAPRQALTPLVGGPLFCPLAVGLVLASDLGIVGNCLAMAFLLDKRGMVPASGMDWKEIGETLSILAAVLSMQIGKLITLDGSRFADLKALALTSVTWMGTVVLGMWLMKSKLPRDLRHRLRTIRGFVRSIFTASLMPERMAP